ncbi:MAG: 7-carboxy-7-deazaguanine synthase QueE [Opitutaceae bacterium]|nr:7-carboxy-7-deazaguanine synthase QueE [Opitutaceae bacterium]
MLISEIFYSIQGEGELTGVPSVFVRTSGCNLRCRWCDTPYASWNPEGKEMAIDEIVVAVAKYPTRHVVLTGGEPMLAKGIRELAAALKAIGYHLTIETAATLMPEDIACDLASLSPKLSDSTPDGERAGPWKERHEASRRRPDVVRAWLEAYPYQLKFVVSQPEDLQEIEALVAELGQDVPRHKILLMPEGTAAEVLRGRSGWLSELCKEHGYRYAHRLHVELYGNTRGT